MPAAYGSFPAGWQAAVLLSVALLMTQWRGTDAGTLDLLDAFGARRVEASVAGLVVLALPVPLVGMVPAVALFMLYLLLAVLRAPRMPSLLTTLIVAVGIEMVFVRWLGVPLPAPSSLDGCSS